MTVIAGTYGPAIMSRWHPWRALASRSHIRLRWDRTPGVLGSWCQQTQTIRLHADQSQAERRSTLTHELIHAERGHLGGCDPAVEGAVAEEAARRLITLTALADALCWAHDEWEVADELWVDVETARIRIDTLTRAEQRYIQQRIDARGDAA